MSNALTVGGDEISFRVTSEDTGGALCAVEVRMAPGGREQTIRNESDAEATAYVVFAPGAAMESFAREAATASDVAAVTARHGVEMTRAVYARA